jgi:hypothetical protein
MVAGMATKVHIGRLPTYHAAAVRRPLPEAR